MKVYTGIDLRSNSLTGLAVSDSPELLDAINKQYLDGEFEKYKVATKSYSTDITLENKPVDVIHSLNTKDIVVSVFEKTNGETVFCSVSRKDDNTITISPDVAASIECRVIVIQCSAPLQDAPPIDTTLYFTKTETTNLLGNKVDKVEGKDLSTNDYTTAEKEKLASLSATPEIDLSEYYTKTEVDNAITTEFATLIDSAPDTLDTLNEIATALGNDPNFATTITNLLSNKVDKVTGKQLSTNDFTTELKTKLEDINLANYYTKTEMDTTIGNIGTLLDQINGEVV